jgi:ribulose-phosphate 3-epimerase
MKYFIAPSILSANFSFLKKEIKMINESKADWIHVDIMDGIFVSNISFGILILKYIKKYSKKPIEIHLMVKKPDKYIKKLILFKIDYLNIHYESYIHLHKSIFFIKNLGIKVGIALNPHTPIFLLKNIIQYLDLVLLMSVNPGFSGQKFIVETYKKIEELIFLIKKKKSNSLLEIDGGINIKNAFFLFKIGTNILIMGNNIFFSKNPKKLIKNIKKINI